MLYAQVTKLCLLIGYRHPGAKFCATVRLADYTLKPQMGKLCHFYSLGGIEDLAQRPHRQLRSNTSTPTGV